MFTKNHIYEAIRKNAICPLFVWNGELPALLAVKGDFVYPPMAVCDVVGGTSDPHL